MLMERKTSTTFLPSYILCVSASSMATLSFHSPFLISVRPQLGLGLAPSSWTRLGSRWRTGISYQNVSSRAKKKSNDSLDSRDKELDDDLRIGLNEVSNEAIKVMLSEDSSSIHSFKDKVDYMKDYLLQEGHADGANFMMIIRGMLDHRVLPEKDDLRGAYKKAFEKIWSILEDSGWLLKIDTSETGVEMVDDELIPPVLQSHY